MNLSDFQHIHCIGIGGIGLSAIAEILLSRGKTVTGSDMKESEMVDKLISLGANVFLGHRAKNVEGADLVVYSAAVSKDNPELVRAGELGIPCFTRAQILGALMEEYETSIAISGTHGKTTTTSMVSLILNNAGKKPTILVGGNLSEFNGNCLVGEGDYFVTEACEYMDSFLSLRPKIELILNIDSDHLDYFNDIDHIVSSFKEFASFVPEDGKLIAFDANSFVRNAVSDVPNLITFGFSNGCDYYVSEISFGNLGLPGFTVNHGGKALCRIQLAIPGEHNILNAVAAFACCYELGVETDVIVDTLRKFTGTARRFDILGMTANGAKVIDDYAHHPTEIKATLKAAHEIPHGKIWCLFQPHTYTRTLALFEEFADAFEDADYVVLADIYAAREKNIHKVSSEDVADEIRKKHPMKNVYYFKSFEEIADFVMKNAAPKDLIITMGAGDIYKVADILLGNEGK